MLVEKMDDDSIYEDLKAHSDLGVVIHNLQNKNEQLQQHVTSLEEDIQKLCNKILEMKQTQENLSRNISELFKTAKNEINRKDRLIAELQSKIDDLVFKRRSVSSNLGSKRDRQESSPQQEVKRPKCESTLEAEFVKDTPGPDSETSEHISHEYDRHHDKDSNRTYKYSNSKESTSRQYVKNEERSFNDRWESSRYDRDHRRYVDQRDRNFRRDRYNHRDNSDKDKSRKEYRVPKDGRTDCSRDCRRNDSPRNNRSDRSRDSRSDEREQFTANKETKVEARFSPVESTKSTPEPILDSKDVLNESREEGEISDIEVKPEPQVKHVISRRKSTITKKTEKKDENLSGAFKDNLYCDKMKSFDVAKYIEKQHEMKEAAKKRDSNIKAENLSEIKNVKQQEKRPGQHSEKSNSIKEPLDKKGLKHDKTTSKKSDKKEEIKEEAILGTKKNSEADSIQDENVKKTDITIISQVILTETKGEPLPTILPDPSKSEDEPVAKIRAIDKLVVHTSREHKIETKRECRVPRNLTGELDIDIQTLKSKEVTKEKQVITRHSERISKRIASLFDTPVKETKSEQHLPLHESFGLTHDGEIEFPAEIKNDSTSNQGIIDLKGNSTPVAEFQIFKTNLPSLDRSNSSSASVQFQVPGGQANIEMIKLNEPKSNEVLRNISESEQLQIPLAQKDNEIKKMDETKFSNVIENFSKDKIYSKSVEISPERLESVKESGEVCSKVFVSTPTVVASESSTDICNISLDLLNVQFDEYKIEDYPNLTAHSEVKHMPSITTPECIKTKAVKSQEIFSSKVTNLSNIIDKLAPSVSNEQKIVNSPNVSGTNSNNSLTSSCADTSISPGSSDSKRRRKRCIMRWAE